MVQEQVGRSPADAGSGHSAKPEPSSTVSAVPASVPNAVTVQVRPEWPSKTYLFRDKRQALMFAHSCRRDGDYRVAVSA